MIVERTGMVAPRLWNQTYMACISMLKNLETNDVCVGTIIMEMTLQRHLKLVRKWKRTWKSSATEITVRQKSPSEDFTNYLYDIRKAKNFRELNITHIKLFSIILAPLGQIHFPPTFCWAIFHPSGANKINVPPNRIQYLYNIFILFHETQFYFVITGNDSEKITQIGAAYIHDKSYSQYLLPSKRISTCAIALTGLTVAGTQMYKANLSTSTSEGLTNFLQWLSSIHKPVVLVAHNARFDTNAFCCALSQMAWMLMQGKLFKNLLTHFHFLENKCLDFVHTSKQTWSNLSL